MTQLNKIFNIRTVTNLCQQIKTTSTVKSWTRGLDHINEHTIDTNSTPRNSILKH